MFEPHRFWTQISALNQRPKSCAADVFYVRGRPTQKEMGSNHVMDAANCLPDPPDPTLRTLIFPPDPQALGPQVSTLLASPKYSLKPEPIGTRVQVFQKQILRPPQLGTPGLIWHLKFRITKNNLSWFRTAETTDRVFSHARPQGEALALVLGMWAGRPRVRWKYDVFFW